MIEFENECVGCPPEMGCLGVACMYSKVPHFYCDSCGDETEIYMFEGEQLCANCIISSLERVDDI